jgi:hypothetical protein
MVLYLDLNLLLKTKQVSHDGRDRAKYFFFLDLANTRSTSLFVRQDFLVIRGDQEDCLLGIRVYELRNIHIQYDI